MRKWILAIMLSVLLLGFGTAQSATLVSNDLPGGAAVAYFQAGAGYTSLVNIQSITGTTGVLTGSLLIHVQVFDMNSNHIVDFNIPLTSTDNVGWSITGTGTTLTLDPYSDGAFGGSGQLPITVLFPSNGADGLQYGYITATITADGRGDRLGAVAADLSPNADPRTFTNFNGVPVVEPFNKIFMRVAILGTDNAIGMNGYMYQDFMNIVTLSEAVVPAVGFVNTVPADVIVACDWNGNGTALNTYTSLADDTNGIGIDPWENYISADVDLMPLPVNIGVVCNGGNRAGRVKALGSSNNIYWGRFNENPATGVHSTLITIAPANCASGCNQASPAVIDGRSMVVIAYNDAESGPSSGLTPPEVGMSEFGTAVTPRPSNSSISINSNAGEAFITIAAPLFGFIYTTGPTYADVYPLVRSQMAIEEANLSRVQINKAITGDVIFTNVP